MPVSAPTLGGQAAHLKAAKDFWSQGIRFAASKPMTYVDLAGGLPLLLLKRNVHED
jgi:hypothetical protein